jgi:hypothetical protein
MVNTKLQFDSEMKAVPTYPTYTRKSPEDIVAQYLKHVFDHTHEMMEDMLERHEVSRDQSPEAVITFPAVCCLPNGNCEKVAKYYELALEIPRQKLHLQLGERYHV